MSLDSQQIEMARIYSLLFMGPRRPRILQYTPNHHLAYPRLLTVQERLGRECNVWLGQISVQKEMKKGHGLLISRTCKTRWIRRALPTDLIIHAQDTILTQV